MKTKDSEFELYKLHWDISLKLSAFFIVTIGALVTFFLQNPDSLLVTGAIASVFGSLYVIIFLAFFFGTPWENKYFLHFASKK